MHTFKEIQDTCSGYTVTWKKTTAKVVESFDEKKCSGRSGLLTKERRWMLDKSCCYLIRNSSGRYIRHKRTEDSKKLQLSEDHIRALTARTEGTIQGRILTSLNICSFVHQCNTFTSYILLIVDMFRPHTAVYDPHWVDVRILYFSILLQPFNTEYLFFCPSM
jgi:hypothetical protein